MSEQDKKEEKKDEVIINVKSLPNEPIVEATPTKMSPTIATFLDGTLEEGDRQEYHKIFEALLKRKTTIHTQCLLLYDELIRYKKLDVPKEEKYKVYRTCLYKLSVLLAESRDIDAYIVSSLANICYDVVIVDM